MNHLAAPDLLTSLAGLAPWLWVALPVAALLMSVANVWLWPRGRVASAEDDDRAALLARVGRVSVCIPARNEARGIEACVRAACALDPDGTLVDEVLVIDDGSSDATPTILARLAAELPLLRVVRVDEPLPPGWVGKPRACDRLAGLARGDTLLFIDADVVVAPGALERLMSLVQDHGAACITAVPSQRVGSLVERLVLPLLHLTYTAWLPLVLVHKTHDPRFLAANGQLLWVSRAALDAVGGFAAVRGEIVDDMALCRAFKRARLRVVFADGHHLGSCRMYHSAREVIDGFSKNLFEGIGGTLPALVGVVGLYGLAFIAPWAVLLGALVVPALAPSLVPAAVAVAAGLALRLLHVVRHGHPLGSALLHPVGTALLLAIAVRSAIWTRRGRISWAGRTYAARARRQLPAAGDAT